MRKPDTKSIWDIYIMNADGSNQRNLTNHRRHYMASWAPDGSQILFMRGPYVFVMSADGSDQKAIFKNRIYGFASWSPDGNKIAFRSKQHHTEPCVDSETDLFIVKIVDLSKKCIVSHDQIGHLHSFIWSRDSKKIIFVASKDKDFDIYCVDLAKEIITNLTNHPDIDTKPILIKSKE